MNVSYSFRNNFSRETIAQLTNSPPVGCAGDCRVSKILEIQGPNGVNLMSETSRLSWARMYYRRYWWYPAQIPFTKDIHQPLLLKTLAAHNSLHDGPGLREMILSSLCLGQLPGHGVTMQGYNSSGFYCLNGIAF